MKDILTELVKGLSLFVLAIAGAAAAWLIAWLKARTAKINSEHLELLADRAVQAVEQSPVHADKHGIAKLRSAIDLIPGRASNWTKEVATEAAVLRMKLRNVGGA